MQNFNSSARSEKYVDLVQAFVKLAKSYRLYIQATTPKF